jgi:molecular chaperone HtpG
MSAQAMKFKTETKQILNLMVHSLYSHKEIFLREIISNASDAIDKVRFESLTNKDILEGNSEWKIKIEIDNKAGTLTVRDNGIGMTNEEAVRELGTIAHSGTREFLALIQSREVQKNPELIGQFGVGFYSSFMVADRVTVISRRAGLDSSLGVRWESVGDDSFTVEDIQKAGRGTDVILHFREEEKKYLDEWEIRNIIRKYSDYIEHPIVMDVEREEESALEKGTKIKVKKEETLNSQKAIWLRDKPDIKESEYNEFYKHISHDFSDPAKVIHYRAEGTSEFVSLLYIPAVRPLDIFYKEYRVGPALYVNRVKIMDHCEELIPPYLRFLRGVVDSSDLPLNVSREILQSNRQIDVMNRSITKKVFDTLNELKKKEYEKFLTFHEQFGRILKEGLHYDMPRREAIAELLLFQSTKTKKGERRSVQDYISGMKEGQEEVYYITGGSADEALASPYLEAFRAKEYEVLVLTDDIDDIIFSHFEYKGKKFRSVVKGDITLDTSETGDKGRAEKKYRELIELMKNRLKDDVKDVRLSGRLKDSPCCLVSDEGALDPQMEKVLRSMGQDVPESKRILEMNPSHPVVESMNSMFEKDSASTVLREYIDLLYDQALLLEGSKPKDPAAFAKAVARFMVEKVRGGKEN